MTIIRNSIYLENYPFKRLGNDLVDSFRDAWVSVYSRRTSIEGISERCLKLLDCYADLNGFDIGHTDIETGRFQTIIEGFFSVFMGESLLELGATSKRTYFEDFKHSLISLFEKRLGDHPEWIDDLEFNSVVSHELDKTSLDQDKVLYWSGWPILSRKNKENYLYLANLYHSHGEEFTVSFYYRWRAFFSKQARCNYFEANYMARFLSKHPKDWPPSTFDDPLKISGFFRALLRSYFLEANNEGLNLSAKIMAWNRMVSNVDEIFFQPGIWPEPFGSGIPKVSARDTFGANTRISKNEDGVDVHDKLLTEVPLYYTDDQAIEVLFSKINKDLDTVERWAMSSARDLRRRQLRRILLSKSGQVFNFAFQPKSIDGIGAENLCASFEHYGFGTVNDDFFSRSIGQRIKRVPLAHELGIPTTWSLFPFMILLVIQNPKITHSFLKELDLFNEKGQLTGFIKGDSGYHLTGYKDRRRSKLSEMKVFLSPRSASLVRQIIEITEPLRRYLKAHGDDNWRKLFLTSGRGWSYPRAGAIAYWKADYIHANQEYIDDIKSRFLRFTDMEGGEVEKLISRVTLATVRASKGVQIYLATQSVQKMAEALGHAAYKKDLLRHYLPDSILAFFQTRWIRIFQRAFVCEALKDSPYLMQATGFESMEELHQFLKNHALKDIPSHLSDPERVADSSNSESRNDQVLISIDKGILAALLSLNQAVNQSKRKHRVSGLARYWSDVSRLIEKEIQEGSDALLKQHLTAARKLANPKKMEGLIYGSTA